MRLWLAQYPLESSINTINGNLNSHVFQFLTHSPFPEVLCLLNSSSFAIRSSFVLHKFLSMQRLSLLEVLRPHPLVSSLSCGLRHGDQFIINNSDFSFPRIYTRRTAAADLPLDHPLIMPLFHCPADLPPSQNISLNNINFTVQSQVQCKLNAIVAIDL